jgi:hypothetical protein
MATRVRKAPEASVWSMISEFPPVLTGLVGVFMLLLEGSLWGVFLALLLIAIHRYSVNLLDQTRVRSAEAEDWIRVRAMTTISCFLLPVYVYLTRN